MAQEPIAVDEALIESVVRTFYGRVRKDHILGPIFEEHIRDWEPHLQNMFAFWSSVMLHTNRYNGRPMPKHVVLPIDAMHFDHWLEIFKKTVDELCLKEDAELFMKKATQIAHSLELGLASNNKVLLKPGERFIRNKDHTL
ncbi:MULTISPECIES: group III truncated hemoglobin [Bartonella]|uniref:group III truncated hemoglobin n=1 Tax=Bartonella TaxID=773 RepID=UPI0018DBF3C4|nr:MULTISPECIES: group III truncated hemoglobin [Bartonella]MBI0169884.1 group III truncated hemoglobin [Bartonella sp. W8167]MBI0176138.1 group III truncated hemoglobin [Bartonella apis]